jgi:hypothetical protein
MFFNGVLLWMEAQFPHGTEGFLSIRGSPQGKPRKASADQAPIIFLGRICFQIDPARPAATTWRLFVRPGLLFRPPGENLAIEKYSVGQRSPALFLLEHLMRASGRRARIAVETF